MNTAFLKTAPGMETLFSLNRFSIILLTGLFGFAIQRRQKKIAGFSESFT